MNAFKFGLSPPLGICSRPSIPSAARGTVRIPSKTEGVAGLVEAFGCLVHVATRIGNCRLQAFRAVFKSPAIGGATTQPARHPVTSLAIVILVANCNSAPRDPM